MENKKSFITKVSVFMFVLAIIIFGALIINRKESKIRKLNTESSNLNSQVLERDSLLNDLFSSFNEIETSLDFIKLRRNQIELAHDEKPISQEQSIINDIRLLDSLLERNSDKIKHLEKKLRNSGIQINSLKDKIKSLNSSIELQSAEVIKLKNKLAQREQQINDLNTKVDGLNSEIIKKDNDLIEKSAIIEKQDSELNKAFLVYGTYKELKENGLVDKAGGFLGIGGTKSIKGDINHEYFMPLDIRETREIPLYAKKVKLISEHPDSSYRLLVDEGLITYLEIENPKEFWKFSKYAVIETK